MGCACNKEEFGSFMDNIEGKAKEQIQGAMETAQDAAAAKAEEVAKEQAQKHVVDKINEKTGMEIDITKEEEEEGEGEKKPEGEEEEPDALTAFTNNMVEGAVDHVGDKVKEKIFGKDEEEVEGEEGESDGEERPKKK